MSNSKSKASGYLKGATILAAAGILSRMLGLFYKVPLYHLVGSYGNGIYGNVTSIYNTLLMVSTVGLPVAISIMISESVAIGDFRGARSIFRVSTLALCLLGAVSTLFLFIGADFLIGVSHWPQESYPSIMAIALAPFIISVCSAFRGYFQGYQIMTPTAISQIIEQIIRVGLGVFLAWFCIHNGYGVGMAVGGAVMGATVGGFFAAIFLGYTFWTFTAANKEKFSHQLVKPRMDTGEILKRLLYISIPVTLTSSIVSLFATVDSMIYIPRLLLAGIDSYTATTMFGDYTNVDTLINVPLVISGNLAVAMIPAISESFALGDKKTMNAKIDIAIRLVVMVALPCCIGLSVLSYGIFDLLFPGSEYGGGMMQVFAYATIFMMLSNIFQSILQSINRMRVPLINLALAAIIRIGSCWIFLAIPAINIYGIGLSSLITFVLLTVANYLFVKRFTGVRIHWGQTVIKPLVSSAIMGLVTWGTYTAIRALLGNVAGLLVSMVASIAVYAFVMLLTGGIGAEELSALPGQNFIMPVYKKVEGLKRRLQA